MRPSTLLLVALSACTPRAVTPPVRTIVPDTAALPAAGRGDVALALGGGGSSDIFGPSVQTGAGRFRQTIAPDLAVEAEGGVLAVQGDAQGTDPNAYIGRVGLVHRFDEHAAAFGGVGGGLSRAAGNWGSVDGGILLAGTNKWIRPTLAASVGYAAPFGNKQFTVYDGDSAYTLQMPKNAFGRVDVGAEIGPRGCLLLGVSYFHFHELTPDRVDATMPYSSDQDYFMLGAGARFPL